MDVCFHRSVFVILSGFCQDMSLNNKVLTHGRTPPPPPPPTNPSHNNNNNSPQKIRPPSVEDNEDGSTFRVKSFFASQFHALRRMVLSHEGKSDEPLNGFSHLDDDRFVQSLAQCRPWDASGGKSNASFCKTLDDRFVVKCVTAHEFDMFIDVAGLYFQHMARQNSALVQILGAYRVRTTISNATSARGINARGSNLGASGSSWGGGDAGNGAAGGGAVGGGKDGRLGRLGRKGGRNAVSTTVCVVVMGNVFYGCQMQNMNVFDLKGKIRQFSKEKRLAMASAAQLRKRQVREAWREWRAGLRIDPHPPPLATISTTPVRLDGDLMELTRGLPVPLEDKGKEILKSLIKSDGDFFLVGEAVDYSLLAGVDVQNHRIVMGVVDYMHSYDILKRIESNVKNMMGEATIRPPPIYYERFLNGLDKYFSSVPMGSVV